MRGIYCDYCGKFIKENEYVYSARMTCGLYCSLICCSKDQFDYNVNELTEEVVDDHAHEWKETSGK